MFQPSLLFLVIAVIATMDIFIGSATSIVPGWHTTIYPIWSLWTFIPLLWLYVVPLCYWVLEKTGRAMDRKIVLCHLVLSLFYFPYSRESWFTFPVTAYFLAAYAVGQLVFLFGMFRAFRKA